MRRSWISVLALSAPLLILGIESAKAWDWDWDRRPQRSGRVYGYGPVYGPAYGYRPTAPIYGYGPGYAPGFGAGYYYYTPGVNMGPPSWWREPRRRR